MEESPCICSDALQSQISGFKIFILRVELKIVETKVLFHNTSTSKRSYKRSKFNSPYTVPVVTVL